MYKRVRIPDERELERLLKDLHFGAGDLQREIDSAAVTSINLSGSFNRTRNLLKTSEQARHHLVWLANKPGHGTNVEDTLALFRTMVLPMPEEAEIDPLRELLKTTEGIYSDLLEAFEDASIATWINRPGRRWFADAVRQS